MTKPRSTALMPFRPPPNVKIQMISRDPNEYTRQRKGDPVKQFTNHDPLLHPFDKAREYTRALNAVKWERLFAKPFVAALDGHRDGVFSMATISKHLTMIASGDCEGELRIWHLPTRRCLWSAKAHDGFVRSICTDKFGNSLYTCSSDQTVKMWKIEHDDQGEIDGEEEDDEMDEDSDDNDNQPPNRKSVSNLAAAAPKNTSTAPVVINRPSATYNGTSAFTCMDHHWSEDTFATASNIVQLWSAERSTPIHTFDWGVDTINTLKFSPVETHLLLSTASDRSLFLYDIRARTPVRRMIMNMQTNACAWNPMEAYYFSTANEDHNAYTFDMRKLDHALNIHSDHVSAVMAIDYAPTGKEIVTGSYDRTIRIFATNNSKFGDKSGGGHSREVYHTKRMQRVFSVKFSLDSAYVFSGSDDTNVRIWKSVADRKLGVLSTRERDAINYRRQLVSRYQHTSEIKHIHRHRHLPKPIHNARLLKHTMHMSQTRKEANRKLHSRSDATKLPTAKEKAVLKVID